MILRKVIRSALAFHSQLAHFHNIDVKKLAIFGVGSFTLCNKNPNSLETYLHPLELRFGTYTVGQLGKNNEQQNNRNDSKRSQLVTSYIGVLGVMD